MTLQLNSPRDKAELIDHLRRLFQLTFFPSVSSAKRSAILEHIEWMRRQRGDLKLEASLNVEPVAGKTQITLSIRFEGVNVLQ